MVRTHTLRRAAAALAFCAIACLSAPASAQYFGNNKVQYRTFDFQILKTEHFDIYFYPSEKSGVDIAARLAERWHARLERLLQHELRGRQPLILYGSHVEFEQTNVIGGELGEGTGGVTEGLRRRIVLPLAGPLADTDHVIGHELVHAFQYDMTKEPDSAPARTAPSGCRSGSSRAWRNISRSDRSIPTPRCGFAMPHARNGSRPSRTSTTRSTFPYRWGQALWAYVAGRWGDEVVGNMLTVASRRGVDAAFEEVLGVSTKQVSMDWQVAIRNAYEPILKAGSGETGTLVIEGKELGADLNVGPAISPDGRWIAFLSTRSFFSVDLYVADAVTGKIVRRLTSQATNPHFSSVQFISVNGSVGQRQSEDRRGNGHVGARRDRDLRRAEWWCVSRDRDP